MPQCAQGLEFSIVKTMGYAGGQKCINLSSGQSRRAFGVLVLIFPTDLSTDLLKKC